MKFKSKHKYTLTKDFFGGMLYTKLSHQVFKLSAVSKLKTKGICKFVVNGGIKDLITAKH